VGGREWDEIDRMLRASWRSLWTNSECAIENRFFDTFVTCLT